MRSIGEVLDNVFGEPETFTPPAKKEKLAANYRKRYQLLSYDDATKLSDVMETVVPVHGKGNFPTLEVTPSNLVQMVREGLSNEGISVPNVRLNGSAATHVLSEDENHTYKDLDLIFAVDLSGFAETCTCAQSDPNTNNNNSGHRRKNAGHKSSSGRKHAVPQSRLPLHKTPNIQTPHGETRLSQTALSTPHARSRSPSFSPSPSDRPLDLNLDDDVENSDAEIRRNCTSKRPTADDLSPCSTSPPTVLDKITDGVVFSVDDVDYEDSVDKDSGYTSSGSSVASIPVSPAGAWVYQPAIRSRTHSLDSSSSITSSASYPGHRSDAHVVKQGDVATSPGNLLRVSGNHCARRGASTKENIHHESCQATKGQCWQKIKEVVMTILCKLLPVGVSRARMTDVVLTDAYVQKMVKISNEQNRWSLISLNNNTGRNLELKFVETMRRQYEFSVDSFQIMLDSYQRFKVVSRALEKDQSIMLSPRFYPSVLAESVYGDFAAALRHLRNKRICTHRPEEIRGGGLLRYCNLLVRDYTPAESDDDLSRPNSPRHGDDESTSFPFASDEANVTSPKRSVTSHSYSSTRTDNVARLEQLMCSRFFIDFSEFPRQRQKLLSYLDSHFACEDDLRFQYLLILRRVVDKSTVCLMSTERGMIVDFIATMARETLAKNVGTPLTGNPPRHTQFQQGQSTGPYPVYGNNSTVPPNPYCHAPQMNRHFQYPPEVMYPANRNGNSNNNSAHVTNVYAPHFTPATVRQTYASQNLYPPFSHPYYPQMETPYYQGYPPAPQSSMTCCPCCHAVYSQTPQSGHYGNEGPMFRSSHPGGQMSVHSAPFYPSSKAQATAPHSASSELVYLPENAKLFYTLNQTAQIPEQIGDPAEPSRVNTESQQVEESVPVAADYGVCDATGRTD